MKEIKNKNKIFKMRLDICQEVKESDNLPVVTTFNNIQINYNT